MPGKYEVVLNELKPKLKEAKEVVKKQLNENKEKGKVVRNRIIAKAKEDLVKAKEDMKAEIGKCKSGKECKDAVNAQFMRAKEMKKEDIEQCKSLKVKERKECKELAAVNFEKAKEIKEKEMQKCKVDIGKCKEDANKKFINEQKRIKDVKEEHLQKCIPTTDLPDKEALLILEDEKAQLQGYIEMHRKQMREWNAEIKEYKPDYLKLAKELKEEREEIKEERKQLKKIKDTEKRKEAIKEFRKVILKPHNDKRKEKRALQMKISALQVNKKVLRIQLEKAKLPNVTQAKELDKRCF
jgi:hypothetical protein